MRSRFRLLIVAAATLFAIGAPSGAWANGRFPDSVKLRFRPGQPTQMVFGVTFGLMESTDEGATWRWACESAVGFTGTYDPDYEITPTGALLATTFDGFRITRDRCTWNAVPDPLGETFVSAISVAPDGTVYAGTSDPFTSAIYKSTDDAATFQPTGLVGVAGDWWQSIDVAPSDASRIYITGFRFVDGQKQQLLFRSTDAGATWVELPVDAFIATNFSDLFIAGIDPTNPDHVYLRLTFTAERGIQETIYRTADAGTAAAGGPSWQAVLTVNDFTAGFTVRANGEVWAGATTAGMFKSTDGGLTFAPVNADPPVNPRCLAERPDGYLYACGNNLPPDSAALTRTLDGVTWSPVHSFSTIAGPFQCADGTLQREDCAGLLWCGLKEQLGILSTEIDCTDAGVDVPPVGDGNGAGGCCDAGGDPPAGLICVALYLFWSRFRERRRRSTRRASDARRA